MGGKGNLQHDWKGCFPNTMHTPHLFRCCLWCIFICGCSYQLHDTLYGFKIFFWNFIRLEGVIWPWLFSIYYVRNSKSHGCIQSGALVTRPNASWHYIQTAMTGQNISHTLNSWKTPHNSPMLQKQSIPQPLGWAMECLLWKSGEKLTVLYDNMLIMENRNTYSLGPPKYH